MTTFSCLCCSLFVDSISISSKVDTSILFNLFFCHLKRWFILIHVPTLFVWVYDYEVWVGRKPVYFVTQNIRKYSKQSPHWSRTCAEAGDVWIIILAIGRIHCLFSIKLGTFDYNRHGLLPIAITSKGFFMRDARYVKIIPSHFNFTCNKMQFCSLLLFVSTLKLVWFCSTQGESRDMSYVWQSRPVSGSRICGKRCARATMGEVNMRIEVPSAGGPAKGRQARTPKSLNQDIEGTFNLDCIMQLLYT